MPPPPAEPLAARIFLGPALRAQPDRRLVALVREGYETAFEEIVRRYRRPLDRFAAAIVGNRSEDVTQDSFSKALLALRGSQTDIELKPWLYRIVRNTALNDLRDGPPPAEELAETIPGGRSAAAEAEGREETAELMRRLRALPDPQRAAIVMRELEGLSHEEIATALGVSGGAARQAIYRARATLRDGLGLLVPLPLLRMLFDHGAEAAGGGGAAAAAAGAASAGGGGATLGALGAGGALKVGVATALIAGSVGAGVAEQHERGGPGGAEPAAAAAAVEPPGAGEDGRSDLSSHRGPGSDRSGHSGHGSGHGDDPSSSGDRSGEGASGGRHSGHHGSGDSDDGSGSSGEGIGGSGKSSGRSGTSGGAESGGGSDGGGSGTSGSSDGSGHHSGSAPPASVLSSPPPTEPTTSGDDSGSDSSGSGDDSGGGGSSDGGEGA